MFTQPSPACSVDVFLWMHPHVVGMHHLEKDPKASCGIWGDFLTHIRMRQTEFFPRQWNELFYSYMLLAFIYIFLLSVLQFYASGLYFENSADCEGLFGFSIKSVMDEVKRGRKLVKVVDVH